MTIQLRPGLFFVFDLDDTLFHEIDYLKSAYRFIADHILEHTGTDIYPEMWQRYLKKENVFAWLLTEYNRQLPHLTLEKLLSFYREHTPQIRLSLETKAFLSKLQQLQIPMGLITDGRSITQRNKLKALDIDALFCDVIISEEFGSEKPDQRNYLFFLHKYPGKHFCFIGDNTSKDFIVPARLGWQTICIKDNGHHIHTQQPDRHPLPDHIISSFGEIYFK